MLPLDSSIHREAGADSDHVKVVISLGQIV